MSPKTPVAVRQVYPMSSIRSAHPIAPDSTSTDPRQRRSILIAVCIALMAVIASVSGLNVAQPDLAVEFDASQTEVLWFINIYTMSLSALLLPLGAMGDQWGRKPMLLVGLVVFGVASAAAGLATSSEIMLAARFFSGVGAAMIMPITLAVITSTFPDEERSKAIGVWTGVAGGGGILGMYLSAVLVDLATWRRGDGSSPFRSPSSSLPLSWPCDPFRTRARSHRTGSTSSAPWLPDSRW